MGRARYGGGCGSGDIGSGGKAVILIQRAESVF